MQLFRYIKSLGNRGRDRDLASSSVLAGIVASQVLNLVTRRFIPPQQWVRLIYFYFDIL